MLKQTMKPNENDSIDCHLQQIGMGSLVCRAAQQTGTKGTTNEVDEVICFNCPAGKIFREVGCDAVLPKLRIYTHMQGADVDLEGMLCKIRRRQTTLEHCQSCNLVTAETTRQVVSSARGLFQAQEFYSAYTDIEKAREAIRDGKPDHAITRSISCLESTMRICHEKLGEPLPDSKSVTDLWKSTRKLLDLDALDSSGASSALMGSLTGIVSHLGGLRNALSDSHGKGLYPPAVSETIAELAINVAATLSTAIVRRFNQKNGDTNERGQD